MSVKSKVKILAVFTAATVFLGVYYARVTSAVLDAGDAQSETALTASVYKVMGEAVSATQVGYGDFFSIVKDGGGNVAYVLTDGAAVNSFTEEISLRVCDKLKNSFAHGAEVPLGVFTGIKLFSGMGRTVRIKLFRINSVKCELVSEFREAGINQVEHSLYAKVVPDVTLQALGRIRKISVPVSVMIYDNIIVGKVPEIYLNTRSYG
ncbi:MAG: sporulation protein YunB [Clostridia bacterium]|nr:sporulation protein YunB [Clostridia bacterium]